MMQTGKRTPSDAARPRRLSSRSARAAGPGPGGEGVDRLAVLVVGLSMVSFLVLYWQAGSPPALRRIAHVDLAGLPVLAGVAWLAFRQ
ncbi:hypothetical protein [Erythrobacter donghaensis]|uniref:hypothetical protein n=1 Tax=Erythrobacter donghaensis TaxID=267135 RepID=UPI00093FAB4B|nr:hypothetical protein [Erythrobacter donghaensis]